MEDAGDVAGTHARVGHLYDLVADVVRQRPPVDVHAAHLVDARTSCKYTRSDTRPRAELTHAHTPIQGMNDVTNFRKEGGGEHYNK